LQLQLFLCFSCLGRALRSAGGKIPEARRCHLEATIKDFFQVDSASDELIEQASMLETRLVYKEKTFFKDFRCGILLSFRFDCAGTKMRHTARTDRRSWLLFCCKTIFRYFFSVVQEARGYFSRVEDYEYGLFPCYMVKKDPS